MKRLFFLFISGIILSSGLCLRKEAKPSHNSILIIEPYRYHSTWVFNDPNTGLVREPFVEGVPEIIDYLVKDINNPQDGFLLFFSDQPFPGYMLKVIWKRKEYGGNWYYSEDLKIEGWLCPALFKYFQTAPKEIYLKAEAQK